MCWGLTEQNWFYVLKFNRAQPVIFCGDHFMNLPKSMSPDSDIARQFQCFRKKTCLVLYCNSKVFQDQLHSILAGGVHTITGVSGTTLVFRLASQSKLPYGWKQLNKKCCLLLLWFTFDSHSFHFIQFDSFVCFFQFDVFVHFVQFDSFVCFPFGSFLSRFISFSIRSFICSIHLRFVFVQLNSTSFVVSTSVHLLHVSLPGSTVRLPHDFVDYSMLITLPYQLWYQ